MYGVKNCSNLIILHVAVQFSQHHLLKRLSLPHCIYVIFDKGKNIQGENTAYSISGAGKTGQLRVKE